TSGITVCHAAIRYVKNLAGSLSAGSSESHATHGFRLATQLLTTVVLPKPAGAEMRVNRWCNTSSSRASNRSRAMVLAPGGWMYSWVARAVPDIVASFKVVQNNAWVPPDRAGIHMIQSDRTGFVIPGAMA